MRRGIVGLSVIVLVAACVGAVSSAVQARGSGLRLTSMTRAKTGLGAPIRARVLPRRATERVGHTASPLTAKPRAYNALLYGQVTDAKTRSPLAGALVMVTAGSRSTAKKTDSFGRFSIKIPGGQLVSVNVKISGYIGLLTAGRVSPHKRFALNLVLKRATPGQVGGPPAPGSFGSH